MPGKTAIQAKHQSHLNYLIGPFTSATKASAFPKSYAMICYRDETYQNDFVVIFSLANPTTKSCANAHNQYV